MATKPWVAPWDPTYNSTSNPVPPDVHLPWQENPVTDPTPTPAPPAPVPAPAAPLSAADFAQQLETEINTAANAELAAAQQKILESLQQPADPSINLSDLTTAAARSRAIRSLVIGLLLAVLYGVVTALGSLGHVDFFTKTGWISVGTLVVGAAVHSAISYIARLKINPTAD